MWIIHKHRIQNLCKGTYSLPGGRPHLLFSHLIKLVLCKDRSLFLICDCFQLKQTCQGGLFFPYPLQVLLTWLKLFFPVTCIRQLFASRPCVLADQKLILILCTGGVQEEKPYCQFSLWSTVCSYDHVVQQYTMNGKSITFTPIVSHMMKIWIPNQETFRITKSIYFKSLLRISIVA